MVNLPINLDFLKFSSFFGSLKGRVSTVNDASQSDAEHEVEQFHIRFCFPDAATADAFRNRFGGECLTHAATSSDAPAVKRIDHNRPKRRVRAIQYGRR
jgi:hypothetical protein